MTGHMEMVSYYTMVKHPVLHSLFPIQIFVLIYTFRAILVDMDARPWDFQAEECALRACVDRFNNRRYGTNGHDPEFQPVDNCILSVLGTEVQLSDEFKMNYERWLDMEVFSNQIDWDQVLQPVPQ